MASRQGSAPVHPFRSRSHRHSHCYLRSWSPRCGGLFCPEKPTSPASGGEEMHGASDAEEERQVQRDRDHPGGSRAGEGAVPAIRRGRGQRLEEEAADRRQGLPGARGPHPHGGGGFLPGRRRGSEAGELEEGAGPARGGEERARRGEGPHRGAARDGGEGRGLRRDLRGAHAERRAPRRGGGVRDAPLGREKHGRRARAARRGDVRDQGGDGRGSGGQVNQPPSLWARCREGFAHFARATSRLVGSPGVFLLALICIAVWAATGPLFGWSDTWQLVVHTGTTIVTFLMVFI